MAEGIKSSGLSPENVDPWYFVQGLHHIAMAERLRYGQRRREGLEETIHEVAEGRQTAIDLGRQLAGRLKERGVQPNLRIWAGPVVAARQQDERFRGSGSVSDKEMFRSDPTGKPFTMALRGLSRWLQGRRLRSMERESVGVRFSQGAFEGKEYVDGWLLTVEQYNDKLYITFITGEEDHGLMTMVRSVPATDKPGVSDYSAEKGFTGPNITYDASSFSPGPHATKTRILSNPATGHRRTSWLEYTPAKAGGIEFQMDASSLTGLVTTRMLKYSETPFSDQRIAPQAQLDQVVRLVGAMGALESRYL